MAEAILRARAGDRFTVASAGMDPKGVHPLTIRALSELNLDTSGLRSKPSTEFLGKVRVHTAIIVCERANQQCPRIYPFAHQTMYWPFDDPADAVGTDAQKFEKFREVRDQIATRIDAWLDELDQGGA